MIKQKKGFRLGGMEGIDGNVFNCNACDNISSAMMPLT